MGSDLFAPPTKEELATKPQSDLFAPPTHEELGQKPQGPGAGQSFIEHGANAATFGYLPQLQALASKPIYAALNKLHGTNVQPDSYVNERDANVERLQKESQDNPKSSTAGSLTGGVLGAALTPIPGLGAGKGILALTGRGAAYGGVQGAVSNPGDVKGVINPTQLPERGENAIRGAEIGAVTGGVAGAVGKGIKALQSSGEDLQGYANSKAIKASGGMLKDYRVLDKRGQIEPIGQYALQNGIVKAGDKFEDVASKAVQANQEAGERLDNIYSSLEGNNRYGFNPVSDKKEIMDAVTKKMGVSVGAKGAASAVENYLDDIGEKIGNKPIDPRQANEIKGALDDAINYSRNPLNKQPDTEKALYEARKIISQKIDQQIDAIGKEGDNPQALKALKDANRDYGYSSQLKRMATDRVSRENANRAFSLTDTIAGSAGSAAGGAVGAALGGDYRHAGEGAIVGGLLGAGVNHLGRTYGPSTQAAGANNLTPIAERTLVPAGNALSNAYNPDLVTRGFLEKKLLEKNQGR